LDVGVPLFFGRKGGFSPGFWRKRKDQRSFSQGSQGVQLENDFFIVCVECFCGVRAVIPCLFLRTPVFDDGISEKKKSDQCIAALWRESAGLGSVHGVG